MHFPVCVKAAQFFKRREFSVLISKGISDGGFLQLAILFKPCPLWELVPGDTNG